LNDKFRSALPPSVDAAIETKTSYRLLDLDEATLGLFLSSYLVKGKTEFDNLLNELNELLPHLPRIPLMLKLVAKVFDENGTVPKQRAALFVEYASVLFRPSPFTAHRQRGAIP
jgi:hypothetical protein